MKKGLLSILASALLVVGCQNYDDQFNNLESQISALATTVAGLSQVQSDLSSLAGTVNSLSSTVSGLGDTIDTAVADGLADIQADIEAIETAVADVASSEEVADLQTAVDASQEDLDQLLTNSNFYDKDLIIFNEATLTFARNLGDKLAIVNGGVSIYVNEAMGLVDTDSDGVSDVQDVLNSIGTITGSFSYMAKNSKVATVNFDSIDGTGDIEVAQPGDYSFATLTKAGNITLGDNYSSKVAIINLEALTTVTDIKTAAVAYAGTTVASTDITVGTVAQADGISFSKATNIHLTALPRYAGSGLTLIADDEESTILVDALASVDASGEESALNLTVTGSAVLNFSNITSGDITATSIGTLTGGADHDGDITMSKVANAVLPNLTGTLTVSDSNVLETLHVIGALATRSAGATADTTHPVIDLSSQTALTSVILEGELGNVTLDGNGNLTDITFTANADAVVINNNGDLEDLDLAGTAHSIAITSNLDLTDVDITTELKTAKGNTAAVKTSGSLSVTGNLKLATLDSAFDPISSLTITDNDDLELIDFAGTELVGAATDKATVVIGGSSANANALVATTVQNDYEATAPTAPAVGAGKISNESGMLSLQTYLTAAAAAASDSGVQVYLDQIETYTTQAAPGGTDVEINDITWADTTNNGKLVVLDIVPADVTAGVDDIAQKRGFVMDLNIASNTTITHTSDGSVATTIFAAADLNTNPSLAIDQIEDADVQAAATAVGVTLAAYQGGNPAGAITFKPSGATGTTELTTGVASTTNVAQDDMLTITVDGQVATATIGSLTTNNTTITDEHTLAAAIEELWEDRWNGTASRTATIWNVSATSNVVDVVAKAGSGSRGHNKSISVSVTQGTDTSTIPFIGYVIGDTRATSDNKAIGDDIILTVTSIAKGTILNQADNVTVVNGATELSKSLRTVVEAATATTNNIYPTEGRLDVTAAEDGTAAVTNSVAVNKNYLSWLN